VRPERAAPARDGIAARPITLLAAAWLVTVQTLAELVHVGGRDELTVGLRIGLMVVLSLQLVFAQRATRFSAGSVLGLFAFEGMTVVAAIGASGALAVRGALALAALVAIGLLFASMPSFPSPSLPKLS
jgi:hypothetical protein